MLVHMCVEVVFCDIRAVCEALCIRAVVFEVVHSFSLKLMDL